MCKERTDLLDCELMTQMVSVWSVAVLFSAYEEKQQLKKINQFLKKKEKEKGSIAFAFIRLKKKRKKKKKISTKMKAQVMEQFQLSEPEQKVRIICSLQCTMPQIKY